MVRAREQFDGVPSRILTFVFKLQRSAIEDYSHAAYIIFNS
jgi:hypothetical protein